MEYYLDQISANGGLLPIVVKEYYMDSGLVIQFRDQTNVDSEAIAYNLLNTAINGVLDLV